MDPLLRRAAPQDAETIAKVHVRSWQAAYRGQLPDRYLDQLDAEIESRAEFWRSMISTPLSPQHEIWVAGRESPVEGFVALGPARLAPSGVGEVYAIYVNPDCWDQRIGCALFTHATSRLADLGYSTAVLWVLESNRRARRFYEIAGWAADGESKLERLPDRTDLHEAIELHEVRYGIRLCP